MGYSCSVEFAVKVTFNPFIADDEPLPERVYYRMWTVNGKENYNLDNLAVAYNVMIT